MQPCTSRAYAITFEFWDNNVEPERPADITAAIIGMDGSLWCDWDRIGKFAALPLSTRPEGVCWTLMARLLVAARGNIPEVTRERAEEIALEYGAKLDTTT